MNPIRTSLAALLLAATAQAQTQTPQSPEHPRQPTQAKQAERAAAGLITASPTGGRSAAPSSC